MKTIRMVNVKNKADYKKETSEGCNGCGMKEFIFLMTINRSHASSTANTTVTSLLHLPIIIVILNLALDDFIDFFL